MASSTVKPLENGVLVRRHDPDTKSKGGIVLPERAQRQSQRATVLAVGPGRFDSMLRGRAPMTVQVGDVVLVPQHTGFNIDGDEDDRLSLIAEQMILAVIGPAD